SVGGGVGGAHSAKTGYRRDRVQTHAYELEQVSEEVVDRLDSTFARYEYRFGAPLMGYLAWGQAERAPDFWERSRDTTPFSLKPEQSRQWDAGLAWRTRDLDVTLSLFAARLDDYLLYTARPGSKPAMRNVDAETRGGELELRWQLAEQWRLDSGVAYTFGSNQSERRALAQMPPLDGKLALTWQPEERWNTTLVGRAVASQERVDVGAGNVAGQDQGATPGFATLGWSAAWQVTPEWQLSGGVDNLFDTFYYEHLSKSVHASQADIGYEQSGRIPEPGRTFWLGVSYRFRSAGAL
ncbi:TonB-dependent copper receptor, partial [Aeromonas diversa CDC 2478-85]